VGYSHGYRPEVFGLRKRLNEHRLRLAAILSPLVFGYVIDKTGNWELPFIGSIGLLFIGSILAFWMKPDRELDAAA
jgi:MFS-type transporter involved in bile tolerance (Atg22 family)